MRLETFDAIASEDKPKLDRSETSAKCDLPIAIVDDRASIAVLASKECRCDVKRRAQELSITYPKCRAVKGGQTPLVEIGAERVSIGVDLVQSTLVSEFG